MGRILLVENAIAPLEIYSKSNLELVERYLSPTEKDNVAQKDAIYMVGPIQAADTLNGNGRIYPRKHLETALNEYRKSLQDGGWGHRDHPDHEQLYLSEISHYLKDYWWDGNNVMGKVQLMPRYVDAAKPAYGMIDLGKRPGISSRAMGSVSQDMDGHVIVENDLQFYAFDLVVTPSTPKAFMSVSESKNPVKESSHIYVDDTPNRVSDILKEVSKIRKNNYRYW